MLSIKKEQKNNNNNKGDCSRINVLYMEGGGGGINVFILYLLGSIVVESGETFSLPYPPPGNGHTL